MQRRSLVQFTNTYLSMAMLICIAIWAMLFYAFILDEVQDNIDDGLKDQKIQIIRATYSDPELLNVLEYDLKQFRIQPIAPLPLEELGKNTFSNHSYYMEYDDELEPYRVLTTTFSTKEGKTYQLNIRTSMVEEDDLLLDLAIGLVALYFFLVISLIYINKWTLRKTWKSFNDLLARLKNHQLGEKSWENKSFQVTEFHQLNESLNFMFAKNEASWKQQKQFIENASHELQTPTAIAMNQLEQAMQDSDIREKELIVYTQLYEQLQRMSQLNKSLLLLSKIENEHYIQSESVNLTALSQQIADDFEPLFSHRKATLNWVISEDFKTNLHPELAHLLISNLLRNALTHSTTSAQITLTSSSTHWSIANTAVNGPLDASQIFNRFYKNSSSKTSTGLGLALVKTIVNHTPNLSIEYLFVENKHIFRITQLNS